MRLWFKTDARFVLVLYLGTCLAQAPASGRDKRMCYLGRAHAEPPFGYLADPQQDMGESRS